MLQPQEIQALERKLVAYNDSTSTQIAVVTVPDLNGYDISDYAFKLGDAWGIGSQKNNGVLLLISRDDRKIWIATGYGMEAFLTDALTKRVIENVIKPNFKRDNYYGGIDQGTDAIIQIASGQYKAPPRDHQGNSQGLPWWSIIVMILLILWFLNRINKGGGGKTIGGRRSRGFGGPVFFPMGGGMFGGGGGGFGGGGGGGFGGFGGGSFGGGGAGGSW